MSYDEHLISMAGGDGEPDAITAITEYVRQRERMTRDLGDVIHNCWSDPAAELATLRLSDLTALLALVREQQAKLDRVEAQAARWATLSDGHAYYAKRIRHAIKGPPSIRAAITATEEGK